MCFKAYGCKGQQTKDLDLILFILNKQKLVVIENMQAFFYHQIGVRRRMSVSLFLVGLLGCVRRGDAMWVGRLSAVFDLARNVTHEDYLWYQSRCQLPFVAFC